MPAASAPKSLPVLLIEDSAIDRELTIAYLSQAWPFESSLLVHTATDGVEALAKMREQRFALIVLDWNLPRAGNGHVLREMRSHGVFIPVVVVTGLERQAIPDNLEELGAAYVNKNSLSSSTLYSAIATALRQIDPLRKPDKIQPVGGRKLVFHSHASLTLT